MIVYVFGRKWKAKLYTNKYYTRLHGDDSHAITVTEQREMHFNRDSFKLKYIRHEVRHAFTNEIPIESAGLDAKQMEEIQCSLDENRWDEMNKVSKEIYKGLMCLLQPKS